MKKRILALVLCFALCLSLMSVGVLAAPGDYAAYFDGGTGEESDPYQIASLDQFNALATIVNEYGNSCADTYFVLTADIGTITAPIGNDYYYFEGHFDGAGHTVTLAIESNADYVGLFGHLGANGTIANVTTAGSVSGGPCGGGVCGDNNGTITNCCNFGDVDSDACAGGVCGSNYGTITNCCNSGNVNSNYYAGGVCGLNNGTITNCCGIGSVNAEDAAGCVCGSNYWNIIRCYYNGDVFPYYGIGYEYEGSNEAYDLYDSSEMVDLLNDYTDSSTGSYPAGWCTWKLGANGPELVHAHRFTGDYVQGTGDNAGKHARKCSDPDCDAVGYTDDSGNPVEGYVPCVCDQEVVADAYLKEDATCVSRTLYYKSCVCGHIDKSDDGETFEDPDGDTPTGHAWKYSAVGNVLTVTCENKHCTYPRPSAFLVLNAKDKVYDGQSADVTILGGDAWEELMGSGSLPTIEYYDSTGKLDAAPTNAGSYTAKITVGDARHGGTAQAAFTILPAPAVPIPAGATYTYDGNERTFMILPEGIEFDSTTAEFNASTGEFIGTDAGTYQVVLRLANSGDMWSDGTTEAKTIRFKIDPASIIIDVKDKTATVGGTAPDLSNPAEGDDYTFLRGPATNDRSRITVALSYQDLNLNQAGSYDIQATISCDRSSNYQLIVAPGTLTVTSAGGAPSAEVPVPTPTTAFFYDGNEKTFMILPEGTIYDSAATTAKFDASTGEFTGTDAGTYQVVLTLENDGDKWSDGTTANKRFTFVITQRTAPTLAISADENGVYAPNSTFVVFFTAQDAADHAGEITVSYPADFLTFDADSSYGLPVEYTADGGTIRLVYPDISSAAANNFFTLAFTVKSGVSLPDSVDIRITDSEFAGDEAAMTSGAIPGQFANGKNSVTVRLLDVETLIVNATYNVMEKKAVFTDYVAGYVLLNVTGSHSGYTFGGTEMFLTEKGANGRNTFFLLIDPTADGLGYTVNEDGTVSLDSVSVSVFVRGADATDAAHDLTLDPQGLGENKPYDVNGTGKIDVSDVRAVFNCQNVIFEPTVSVEYMATYLRADVVKDGVVDGTDLSALVLGLLS